MKEIKLFDYQEDMKERIEKALRFHRSVMAQMPTGTGKTVLLASVVESFLREHSNCHVWIVAHRRELVSQIKDTLNKFLLNFSFSNHPGPLSSGAREKTALRCSEPLRYKVGGASKPSPWFCGMGPLGEGSLQFIIYC
ncbi:DEAD/DEAH box helicase family protein [Prevotella copri]|uniref:DEAD/DEAH box helicase family protein n=1 Tax=Segatella copri TaxID=165179 RepID=UPI0027F6B21C|nr:DEAD/DEAH box helicase family protein [Segatella copri]